ncbi:TraE/TraK family type IV conjugative transfer system protein [Aquamicrobium sp.]|uniref:TraE/TraK family type IV conjugative transfer system protein n=1 Tax=Aquamicrobium sp. TaxID=1872579 RepID=UPI0025876B8F|nr:TraE/TraK family type IV conjugative transfer system protein [Aquamicrobium sp.]MCK9550945.1 hypothetical protein [Aquamicrobium sp.]
MRKKITGKEYLDKQGIYIDLHNRDTITKIIFGVLLVVLGLSFFLLKSSMVMTMQIPSVIYENKGGELAVGYNDGNELFYKVWGEYFVAQYANLQHRNVKANLDSVIKLIEVNKAKVYEKDLQKKADYISKNNITAKYIPSSQSILKEKVGGMSVFESRGMLIENSNVGGLELKKDCTYKIGMYVKNYRIFIGSIYEKCTPIAGMQ